MDIKRPVRQPAPQSVYRTKLINELNLLNELWQRLAISPWNPESLGLVGRLVRSLRQTMAYLDDGRLPELAEQLEGLINSWRLRRRAPEAEERARFKALLEAIAHALNGSDKGPEQGVAATAERPSPARIAEVFVVQGEGGGRPLMAKLDEAGFVARYLRDLRAAEAALTEKAPLALIVQAESLDGHLSGIEMVARLRSRIQLSSPVFFTASKDDFDTRAAAVRAGGAGFFVEPVDHEMLLSKLTAQLEKESGCAHQRLLIVDDQAGSAQNIADYLKALGGFVAEIVTDPPRLLETLQHFQPDLVVLNLDLKEADGLELVRLLRQHEACDNLPMILLTEPSGLLQYLPYLDGEADDLLSKPVMPDYLCWLIRRRLNQASVQRNKHSALIQKDPVSGLFSRQFFLSELERTMSARDSDEAPAAVMLIMLENWRGVREQTNAAVADEVLWRVAGRLRRLFGQKQKLARFGDAIFAALLPGSDKQRLNLTAELICEALEKSVFKVGTHSVRVRACIGISIAEKEDQDFLALIQRADLACSLALETPKKAIHIHDSVVDRKFRESRARYVLGQISEALLNRRLTLLFQPIVSLGNKREQCYEVFLRLRDRQGHELLPETVFDVTKKHALGARMDGWVVNESLKLLAARPSSAQPRTLFINLSPATLLSRAMRPWLRERLEKAGTDPRCIVFELAEDRARQNLFELRSFLAHFADLGCGLSLDRFGCRPDSLSLLEQLDVNYVKLNSRFSRDLRSAESPFAKHKLMALTGALNDKGVTIIMSGIEDVTSLPTLWSCGVQSVQGFSVQRPSEVMSYNFS